MNLNNLKSKIKLGVPQIIILIYLFVLTLALGYTDISLVRIFNESLIKWCMNGILVLSLVPMINTGAGKNFGLPIGICAGLVGLCIAIELRLEGFVGFFFAILAGSLIAVVFGKAYSIILNKLKGNEEIVGTFAGFAFIPIMNIFWTIAPFTNRQMLYPVGGQGLRPKISLDKYFENTLDNFFVLEFGEFKIPLGLILFFLFLCLIVDIFFKTKLGVNMRAIAENEKFVRLAGVDINKHRTYAIIFSTILAAIGICVYSQSYGFVELYNGPFMMAFPAVSAILIGGASYHKSSVFNVIIGSYLYQSTFLLSVPVANELIMPEMSEIFRAIITNGIILYAFLHEGVLKKNEKL